MCSVKIFGVRFESGVTLFIVECTKTNRNLCFLAALGARVWTAG